MHRERFGRTHKKWTVVRPRGTLENVNLYARYERAPVNARGNSREACPPPRRLQEGPEYARAGITSRLMAINYFYYSPLARYVTAALSQHFPITFVVAMHTNKVVLQLCAAHRAHSCVV
jgi:hypothetical protein